MTAFVWLVFLFNDELQTWPCVIDMVSLSES